MTQNKFIYDFGIDHYKGLQGVYFNRILKNILHIAKLNQRTSLKVLDFGCGLKKLKPYVLNYTGYDIDKRFTEIKDWRDAEFDIVIANAVFMYMTKRQIQIFINQLYKHNKNVEVIFGATRMNIITRIIKFLRGEIKGYADVKLSYNQQIDILKDYFQIINRKPLFGLHNTYLMRFR